MSSSAHNDPLDELPHRPPFRFVTRIVALTRGVGATGMWEVRGDEEFLAGHFPGRPLVPGVLIGEALAQVCGVVGIEQSTSARLSQINVRFRAPVEPPAGIALLAKLVRSLGNLSMYDVTASVRDVVVADGTIVLGVATQ